jgi:hypothetical protein
MEQQYENGALPNQQYIPLNQEKQSGGTESTPWFSLGEWINVDRWSWWFKWGAIYTIVVYAGLIIAQIINKKETKIEKLRNMMERDEKWADIQRAYRNADTNANLNAEEGEEDESLSRELAAKKEKTESESSDLAKMWTGFANYVSGLFTALNQIRIFLLENIWGWSKDTASDFVARRSAKRQ